MSEERKLASIQVIEKLSPIDGSDFLLVANMVGLGWHVVVKKDEFKVGDKVIYIEIDSCLPEKPEFEFMAKYKYRVKTIKLRGQISQGMILPISSIRDGEMYLIGEDITNLLGITKYLSKSERDELAEDGRKIALKRSRLKKFMYRFNWYRRLFMPKKQVVGFPYWVKKTDEERIQNIPQVLDEFKDEVVYITEKVDYQSATFTGKMLPNTTPIIGKYLPRKFKFIVASRNLMNNDKSSLYWQIAEKYNLEKILKENPTLTIQGEQGSSKVQGNKYGISEPKIWIFNIYDHEKDYHYGYYQMLDFCMKYSLTTVPYIGFFKLKDIATTVDEMIEYSKGKSIINPKINREGVVVRCVKNGKKLLSFKAINPDFLLKYDSE
jgi:hypothetical protein